MSDAFIKIISIVVPAAILLSGLGIAIYLYIGTRNSVEEAKNKAIYFAAGLISIGLMFLVGGKLFGTISAQIGGYLKSALPGVQGVETITAAIVSVIGLLTFASIIIGALLLIIGTQDSIENGKKRITWLLGGGIAMLIVFSVVPNIAAGVLQTMKDQSNTYLKGW